MTFWGLFSFSSPASRPTGTQAVPPSKRERAVEAHPRKKNGGYGPHRHHTPRGHKRSLTQKESDQWKRTREKRTEGMAFTGITSHADTNSPSPKKGATSGSAPAKKERRVWPLPASHSTGTQAVPPSKRERTVEAHPRKKNGGYGLYRHHTPRGHKQSLPQKGSEQWKRTREKRTEGMALTGITPHADTNSLSPKKGASSASAAATKN